MPIISNLPQGGTDTSMVTATANDVLSGKVIVNAEGNEVTGSMTNNGAVSQALNAGGSYTIPKGYHDGTGKVTANSLASQTDGTAVAGDILKDKTAYVDGSKVTGTMTNNGAVSASINAGGTYTIPAGYHNGSGKVVGNSLASQTDGTATAAQILTGQTAYVDGVKVTGSMTNNGAKVITPSTSNITIPAGYHNGSGYVVGDADLVAGNIKSGANIFGVAGSYTGGVGNYIKSTNALSFTTNTIYSTSSPNHYGILHPSYGNSVEYYSANVVLPGANVAILNDCTSYYATVSVVFTKTWKNYNSSGNLTSTLTNAKYGTKYFIRYQDGTMYIYTGSGPNNVFMNQTYVYDPADYNIWGDYADSPTTGTDGLGSGWSWHYSSQDGFVNTPYYLNTNYSTMVLIGVVSGKTATRTVKSIGTHYNPYLNEISNVSASVTYEIYAK